ncbi:hypothetical protein BGX31_011267 [Mortierella sp. GBA43]|nr:hypothetical protein BGX31_011267 [Mortierella sp. GBA43]
MAAYGGPPAPYGGPAPYMTPQPYPAQYPPAQAQAPVIIPQQPQAPARGNHSTGAMLGAGAAGAAAALLVGGVAVAGYEHLRHEYDPDVVVVQQPVFEYGPTTIIENNETIIYNDNEYNDYH